jgi:hypothetical protein
MTDEVRRRAAPIAVGGMALGRGVSGAVHVTEVEVATRCAPAAQNGYKVALLTGTVLEVLESAFGAAQE